MKFVQMPNWTINFNNFFVVWKKWQSNFYTASTACSSVYTESYFLYCPHDSPHLLELLKDITKSLESCLSSLEIKHISYRNNVIHVASLTHDVPKYRSNNM